MYGHEADNRSVLMRLLWNPAVWLCLSGAGLFGQALRVSPATGKPGEWVVIEVSVDSRTHAPAALQWELTVPAKQLGFEGDRIARAPLGIRDAGKSLECGVVARGAETQTLRCIVGGGAKPIPNGTLALVTLRVAARALSGPAPIRLDHAIAVDSRAVQSAVDPSQGVVTINLP